MHQLSQGDVRKELYQGEWYYNIIDVVAVTLNTDFKTAKNYYHVLKNRLNKNRWEIPIIHRLKSRSSDGKMYFTEFTNSVGVQLLEKYLEPGVRRKNSRLEVTKTDEVAVFHPLVIQYFKEKGGDVQHHVRLPSGHIIDVVALFSDVTYVVECKLELDNGNLYGAIGQVLCYCHEYEVKSTPAIACYETKVSDYALQCCRVLNVELFAIPHPTF